MGFIPIDQMNKLREAAKGGDQRARDILNKYLNRGEYAADLDAYFKPVENPAPAPAPTKVIENQGNPGSAVEAKATTGTGNAKLDKFLADNGIKEGDLDYDDAVEDYYNEFPEERPEPSEEPAEEPVNEKVDEPVDEPVDEEAQEAAKSLGKILIDVISECDKEMLEIMQNPNVDENAKKGAMTSLQEIKQNTIDNIEKVKKIQKSFDKKEEAPLQ